VWVQVGVWTNFHTTDVVFGRKGYEITFAIENADFVPVDTSFEDHRSKDDSGNGMEGKPEAKSVSRPQA
jgi:hypothetical protein